MHGPKCTSTALSVRLACVLGMCGCMLGKEEDVIRTHVVRLGLGTVGIVLVGIAAAVAWGNAPCES